MRSLGENRYRAAAMRFTPSPLGLAVATEYSGETRTDLGRTATASDGGGSDLLRTLNHNPPRFSTGYCRRLTSQTNGMTPSIRSHASNCVGPILRILMGLCSIPLRFFFETGLLVTSIERDNDGVLDPGTGGWNSSGQRQGQLENANQRAQ